MPKWLYDPGLFPSGYSAKVYMPAARETHGFHPAPHRPTASSLRRWTFL